jgi:hypothetical protein
MMLHSSKLSEIDDDNNSLTHFAHLLSKQKQKLHLSSVLFFKAQNKMTVTHPHLHNVVSSDSGTETEYTTTRSAGRAGLLTFSTAPSTPISEDASSGASEDASSCVSYGDDSLASMDTPLSLVAKVNCGGKIVPSIDSCWKPKAKVSASIFHCHWFWTSSQPILHPYSLRLLLRPFFRTGKC